MSSIIKINTTSPAPRTTWTNTSGRPNPTTPPSNNTAGQVPGPWSIPTTNSDIVWAVADVLQTPPSVINNDYNNEAAWVASFLSVPVADAVRNNWLAGGVTVLTSITKSSSNLWSWFKPVVTWWDQNEQVRTRGMQAQCNVLAFVERVTSWASQARSAGLDPPDDPFAQISALNAKRSPKFARQRDLFSTQLADDLVFNMKAYVDLIQAYNAGGIDLSTGQVNAAQLTHVQLSYDGLGGSGNTAADIKTFLPSLDAQKEEAARKALEVLDFSKRIPYVLFTADYVPQVGGSSQGVLVGWKKIADASGYVVKRHAVFNNLDTQFTVDNAAVSASTAALLPYAKTYTLSYFDNIDDKSVQIYCDSTAQQDEIYVYRIQGYQVQAPSDGIIFSVTTTPISFTTQAKNTIALYVQDMSYWPAYTITGWTASGQPIKNYIGFQETISPWPAVSKYIYGDVNYDWILAAVNVRASMQRKDPIAVTRQYSYLTAHSDFLHQQAAAGKLVKPMDVSAVAAAVNDSIQKYGVEQTLQNILDETGITFYYEGRDPKEDAVFHRAGSDSQPVSSKLFDAIGSSIDPETATLDLKHLMSNVMNVYSFQLWGGNASIGGVVSSNPTEVAMPDLDEKGPDAQNPTEFINQIGDLSDSTVDLTTFEGLSKLMRCLRIISDFGPNRLQPTASQPVNTAVPVAPPAVTPPSSPSQPQHNTLVDRVLTVAHTVIPTGRSSK